MVNGRLKQRIKGMLNERIRSLTMIFALFFIWIVFESLTKGVFLMPRNLVMLARQTSVTALIALPMTLIIVAGHIDLSAGSLLGFIGALAACLNVWYGVNAYIIILIVLVVGALLGAFQGFWVSYARVPSFIATLGGSLLFKGALLALTKGTSITPVDDQFKSVGQGYVDPHVSWIIATVASLLVILLILNNRFSSKRFGFKVNHISLDILKIVASIAGIMLFVYIMNQYQSIPIPVILLVFFTILFAFISKKTTFGRKIYAIGDNLESARLSGINDKINIFIIFVMMGVMTSLAGYITTARLNAATAQAGTNAELDAIAACVIGGTSLSGGIGSILGAVVGALVMASLDNGMSLMNIPFYWQYMVKGMVLILAVCMDMAAKKRD